MRPAHIVVSGPIRSHAPPTWSHHADSAARQPVRSNVRFPFVPSGRRCCELTRSRRSIGFAGPCNRPTRIGSRGLGSPQRPTPSAPYGPGGGPVPRRRDVQSTESGGHAAVPGGRRRRERGRRLPRPCVAVGPESLRHRIHFDLRAERRTAGCGTRATANRAGRPSSAGSTSRLRSTRSLVGGHPRQAEVGHTDLRGVRYFTVSRPTYGNDAAVGNLG